MFLSFEYYWNAQYVRLLTKKQFLPTVSVFLLLYTLSPQNHNQTRKLSARLAAAEWQRGVAMCVLVVPLTLSG